MIVTPQLVMKLQRLRHLSYKEAAELLRLPIAEIEEAARMGSTPMRADDVEPPRPRAIGCAARNT